MAGFNMFIVVAVVLVAVRFIHNFISNRNKLPLPPQPAGWPILGNTLEFIPEAKAGRMHTLLQKWAEIHGEVMRVQVGPTTNYYLNSDRAVKAIFDKDSASSSERPRWIVSNELLYNSWNVLLLNASDPRWKLQRKITHSEMMSIPMADAGLPFLYHETARFLHEVAHDPQAGLPGQDLWAQIGRYTYSNFAMQSFGFSIDSSDDPVIDYIHETGKRSIEGTLPGSHIVDILSILNTLPLWVKPWERKARAHFVDDIHWVRKRLLEVRKTPAEYTNSLLLRVLRDKKRLGISSDDEAAFLSLMLIIGAADTSRISTWSSLEAMMMFQTCRNNLRRKLTSSWETEFQSEKISRTANTSAR